MKYHSTRKLFAFLLILTTSLPLAAFGSGFHLQLKADFGGTMTLPSISDESLFYLNSRATAMSGMPSNLLMGGKVEVGYIFRSHDFLGLKKSNPFSGLGLFAYLGFSQGNTSQKITAVEANEPFDIFISVNFLPVVEFGLTGKAYFLDNKLAVGLSAGGKMIADMTPEYLCYSTVPDIIPTEIGRVIVTEDMMSKMNPFMFSARFSLEYNIHILPTTELVLGLGGGYNIYRPLYLTVPPSLLNMAIADNPDFDINRKHPDYWLNSFDIGVSIGLSFKL